MPKTKSPSMYDMFSGMLKDHIGRSEFVNAFKEVVAQIQKLKLSNAQEIAAMHAHVQDITQKVDEKVQAKLATLQHGKDGKTPLKGIDYLDGEDGQNGLDGKTPTQEELLALITPLIPKVKDGKDAEADIDAIVTQVMAKIPKRTGTVGWGAHPLVIQGSGVTKVKVARQINFTGATVTHSATGVTTVAISAGALIGTQEKSTTTPNGIQTTFAFTHTPSVIVWNGAIQTLTDDYTVSVNNITFTASAGIPQTNDKIVNIYA